MTLRKNVLRAATAALLVAGLVHAAPAAAADLALALTAPANIGYPTAYRLLITNNGPDAAAAVTVTGTLPTDAKVVGLTNCKAADDTVDPVVWFPCTVTDSLASGATSLPVTITVQYPVPATCPAEDFYGPVTFSVASTTADADATNNTASAQPLILLPLVDIAVTMTGPASIPHGGGTFVYDYTIKNNGPCDAPDMYLAVDDSVTTGFTWVSATGICGGADASTGDPIVDDFLLIDGIPVDYMYCTAPALAVGASLTGTKTYHLVPLASDLISSNQGTGLQVIFYDPATGDDLVLTDHNGENDVSDVTYVVTKSTGCSTTGASGGLMLLGLGLAFLFLKRRSA